MSLRHKSCMYVGGISELKVIFPPITSQSHFVFLIKPHLHQVSLQNALNAITVSFNPVGFFLKETL